MQSVGGPAAWVMMGVVMSTMASATTSSAWADDINFRSAGGLDSTPFAAALIGAAQPADPAPDGAPDDAADALRTDLSLSAPPTDTFGQAETWRWTVQAGFGADVKGDDNYLALGGVGLSYFLVDDLSLNFELNGFYVDQEGEDSSPIGVNFNLLLRWHFFKRDSWTIYFDGGAGMLYTSDDVPDNGSSFNFTPQAGLGMSFALNEKARLLLGARWHHISNANTYDENPGRDSVQAYVGLSFPM